MSHVLVPKDELEALIGLTAWMDRLSYDNELYKNNVLKAADTLNNILVDSDRPFGIKQGERLQSYPKDRRPIFKQAFDDPRWLGDMQLVAYLLQYAVEKAAPYVKLEGPHDPLFYDRGGYFSGVLDSITARGLDTYHDPEKGFAIFAPRHPVPAAGRSFGKAVSNAPRPS